MSSKLGTVFVELLLDGKIYKQQLSETLTSTEATAKGIETSWRALGTKAGESFEAQRRAAENAYTLIKNHATSSANDIMRAEEAKNAKIQSLNDQQFGKQTSLIDNIKNHWLGMVAAGTAAFMAIQQVVAKPIEAYMESETALLKMGMAMKNQGDFSRVALADLEDYSKQIQRTTAYEDDATLAVMANLKSFGLSNEQVKLATQAALDLATAKANEGMTVERASEILGKSYLGITTGLKKLGIQVDENAKGAGLFESVMGQVNARFGGSAQAELLTYAGQWKQLKNQWQDVQEFLGLVFLKTMEGLLFTAGLLATTFMNAGSAILGVIRIITAPFTFLLDQFAKLAELAGLTKTAEALRAISSATQEAQNSIKSAREGVIAWTAKQYDAMVATDKVSSAIDKMGIAGKRTQAIDEEAAKAAKKAAAEKETAIKSITEAIRKSATEAESIGKTQYEKDVARINSEADKYKKAGVDKITVAKYVAVEMEAANKKAYEEMAKEARKASDVAVDEMERQIAEGVKLTNAHIKGAEEYKKLSADAAEFAATENERAINKILADQQVKFDEIELLYDEGDIDFARYVDLMTQYAAIGGAARVEKETENAKKIADINYNLIKDIQGYEEIAYNMRIAQIEAQAEVYRKDGADQAAIARWVAEETIKAYIDMGKKSDDFFAGVNAGYLEMQRNATTFGEAGYEIFKTFASQSEKAVSDILFEGIKAGTIDTQAVWKSFNDAMLRKFTDTVSQMIIEAAAKDIAMMFRATWTSDSSAILGIINKGWDLWNSLTGGGYSNIDVSGIDITEFATHARGGAYESGKPFWAGEKGPELIFPKSSGMVLPHEQSVAYAARNGGYIPGYAGGTADFNPTDTITTQAESLAAINGWIYDAARTVGANDPGWVLGEKVAPNPAAITIYIYQNRYTGKFATSGFDMTNPSYKGMTEEQLVYDYLGWTRPSKGTIWDQILEAVMPNIVFAAAGYAVWGAGGLGKELSSLFGEAALAETMTAGEMYGLAETGAGAFASWADLAIQFGSDYLKRNLINSALKFVANAIFGGLGGTASYSFVGAEGDLSWLYDAMKGIAPKETKFAFSAQNGLDRVPFDNFPIRAHADEAVLNKRDAATWRGGGDNSEIVAEIKALKEELRAIGYPLVKNTGKSAKIADRWDVDGIPAERTIT